MSVLARKPKPLEPFVDGYRAWSLGRGCSRSVVIRSLSMPTSKLVPSAGIVVGPPRVEVVSGPVRRAGPRRR